MARMISILGCFVALQLALVVPTWGQEPRPGPKEQEASLIEVLKSAAPLKEKADACRELATIGTRNAVAPLSALLADPELSHMARYGLEPIPDPAVDDALRAAIGKVKGRLLAGVVGSIGVRRDIKAVEPVYRLLKDPDADVVQAAARALGMIGTASAAKALQDNLSTTPAAQRPAFYEGLFRCAEALVARGQRGEAIATLQASAIYQRLARFDSPPQIRDAASRKARALQQESGPTL